MKGMLKLAESVDCRDDCVTGHVILSRLLEVPAEDLLALAKPAIHTKLYFLYSPFTLRQANFVRQDIDRNTGGH